MAAATRVRRTAIEAEIARSQLRRVLRSDPGRRSTCTVGSEETARLAHGVYTRLPTYNGASATLAVLARSVSLDEATLRRVLHVMWVYGLVQEVD